MTGVIDLGPVIELMREPIIQELLAQAKASGAISIIARCDIRLEMDGVDFEAQERIFDSRRSFAERYGEPSTEELTLAVADLGKMYAEIYGIADARTEAARRLFRRLSGR